MKCRLRAACVCVRDGVLLLVLHHKPGRSGPYWVPPGGGVRRGETLLEAALRELHEETGLHGEVRGLLGMRHVWEPEEAVFEAFLAVEVTGGALRVEPGHDVVQAAEWVPLATCGGRLVYPPAVLTWAADLAAHLVPLDRFWMGPLDLRAGPADDRP